MSKVPPKINQRPAARPRRPHETRTKKPGENEHEDELSAEYAAETMGERLHREREGGRDAVPSDEAREMAEAESRDEDAHKTKEGTEKQAGERKSPPGKLNDQRGRPAQSALTVPRPTVPPQVGGKVADGFESAHTPLSANRLSPGAPQTSAKAPNLAPAAPMLPQSMRSGGGFGDAMKFLNDARESGFYFKVRPRDENGGGGQGEEQEGSEESELEAAVEAARAELGALRGVEAIEAGLDHESAPVVLISAGKGFCQSSMAAIPERYGRFPTLVGLPYDLLPLRRL